MKALVVKVRCRIAEVAKQRSGHLRFWCSAHDASATGKHGKRLEECEAAYLEPSTADTFVINTEKFPGGIGLWGAVQPVYDTTGVSKQNGVHVHARSSIETTEKKEVDETYEEVIVNINRDLFRNLPFRIGKKEAVSYFVSKCMGAELTTLYCTKCGHPHLDAEEFAVKPHKKHLCHKCGKEFIDTSRGISNPIIEIQRNLEERQKERSVVCSNKHLEVRQDQLRGGIEIWASNPAFLWTRRQPEEKGIHVHTYLSPSQRDKDDTFGSVVIDGIELDEESLRYFMAQQSLDFLVKKIVALDCPSCGKEHLDTGFHAFNPHRTHTCEYCEHTFDTPGQRKNVVSNPFIRTISELKKSHNTLAG